jgi:hypothetical protein
MRFTFAVRVCETSQRVQPSALDKWSGPIFFFELVYRGTDTSLRGCSVSVLYCLDRRRARKRPDRALRRIVPYKPSKM